MALNKYILDGHRSHHVICGFLILLLGLCYYLCTGQIQFLLIICATYSILYILLKLWSSNSKVVLELFSLFFIIYYLLVLVTQRELIHDPYEDFYVHNDAAWSFYTGIMEFVLPCEWAELPEKTLFHTYFLHYPFSAFVMGAVGKMGQDIGIVDLRLLLRMISPVCGVLIISVMANLLSKKGFDRKTIYKLLLPFGLFSYLYITSAIGTRDIHVCLVYTIAMYVCLCDKIRYRAIKFVVLFLLAYGCRPENGYLYLIFPITFFYCKYKSKIGILIYVFITLLLVGSFVYLNGYISTVLETFSYYDDRAQSLSNTGGLFLIFYNLPFPLDKIAMTIYTFIMPQPATAFLFAEGYSIMNLPFVLSPYLMFLCILVSIRYIFKKRSLDGNIHIYIIMSFIVIVATIIGDPHLRRAFAAIPGLYMCYCLVEAKCPKSFKFKIKAFVWPAIAFVSLLFVFYTWENFA